MLRDNLNTHGWLDNKFVVCVCVWGLWEMDFQGAKFQILQLQSWHSYLEYCLYDKKKRKKVLLAWTVGHEFLLF